MSLQQLPIELLTEIVAVHLPQAVSISQYLKVRLLSAQFNDIILYALFDLHAYGFLTARGTQGFARSKTTVIKYWKCFRVPRNGRLFWEGASGFNGITPPAMSVHGTKVLSAIELAVQQLCARHNSDDLSVFPDTSGRTITVDECFEMLCYAAMLVHGPQKTWAMLTSDVEADNSTMFDMTDQLLTSSYQVDVWFLYGVAYQNDIQAVETLLATMKTTPADQFVWTRQLQNSYRDFVDPKPQRIQDRGKRFPVSASMRKQIKWIKAVGAILIIATSLGHIDLIALVLKFEPNAMQLLFRTQFYRTSNRDAIRAAILNRQPEAFRVLVDGTLRSKWPLITRAGSPRREYFSALQVAVRTSRVESDSDEILERLFEMSDYWQCSRFLCIMLRRAAENNDIRRGQLALKTMSSGPNKHTDYVWVESASTCKASPKPKVRYALGIAALNGCIEFVDLILESRQAGSETGSHAIECAIHTLTCCIRKPSDNHRSILKVLLHRAASLCLDDAFIRAASKHDAQFVENFIPKVNLKKRICAVRTMENSFSLCRGTRDRTATPLIGPTRYPTLGEIALAASLHGHNFEVAALLMKSHNVTLENYFVSILKPYKKRFEMAQLASHGGLRTTTAPGEVWPNYLPYFQSQNTELVKIIFRPAGAPPKTRPVKFCNDAQDFCRLAQQC